MATTVFQWVISQLNCAVESEGLPDVINMIHWRYNAVQEHDGKVYFADTYGASSVAQPNPQNFIPYPFDNCPQIPDTSIESTMDWIYHSTFFVGLSSGLSWLAWSLGKQVVLISNFTEYDHEFLSNCIRITNDKVCHGCWNKPDIVFDKGNWNWCPYQKNFECQTSITAEMVINKISRYF